MFVLLQTVLGVVCLARCSMTLNSPHLYQHLSLGPCQGIHEGRHSANLMHTEAL